MYRNFFTKEDPKRALLEDEKAKHTKLIQLAEEYRQRKNKALTEYGREDDRYTQLNLIYKDLLQKITHKQENAKPSHEQGYVPPASPHKG